MQFIVEGRPVPQGSMTASYNKRLGVAHVHHVQGAALAAWRASIRLAAREAGAIEFVGPVKVQVGFGMPRPKAHMELRRGQYVVKMRNYYDLPTVAPDLDKLTRALLDALTGICYHDDAQVVSIVADKVYGDFTYIEVTEAYGSEFEEPSLGLGEAEKGHP